MTTITDFKITLMTRYEYEEDEPVTEEKITSAKVTGLENEYEAEFIMWIEEEKGSFIPYSIYAFIVSDNHNRQAIKDMLSDMNSKLVRMIRAMYNMVMTTVEFS